jgi:hypothetical protein
MKKVKKVDLKMVAKESISEIVASALKDAGFVVKDGVEFGFTKGSLVVETPDTDVQVKLITPKAGIAKYVVPAEEDVVEAE